MKNKPQKSSNKDNGDKKTKLSQASVSKKNNSKGFGEAFSESKKRGDKTFVHGGKKYTTTTAQEIAKKQTMEQNLESAKIADSKAKEKGYKNKGLNQIGESYSQEFGRQHAKKYKYKQASQKNWSPPKQKKATK